FRQQMLDSNYGTIQFALNIWLCYSFIGNTKDNVQTRVGKPTLSYCMQTFKQNIFLLRIKLQTIEKNGC
ncbi:hypothetical protein, partial [Bacillus canaveralius]|uniref:hypothetical protein n=1 Tax=Bacillus canaveralius TaxID=1403243 RepID=UPI001C8BCE85